MSPQLFKNPVKLHLNYDHLYGSHSYFDALRTYLLAYNGKNTCHFFDDINLSIIKDLPKSAQLFALMTDHEVATEIIEYLLQNHSKSVRIFFKNSILSIP